MSQARGRVLEIGIGSGTNLALYDPSRVDVVLGLDPNQALLDHARVAARTVGFRVELQQGTADRLAVRGSSIDTVVLTYALCSVDDDRRSLAEVRRVLAPGGSLLFSEHGVAPDTGARLAQSLVRPAWRLCGGGCVLNKNIPGLLRSAGFVLAWLESGYVPGWAGLLYNYAGVARPESAADRAHT